MRDQQVLAYGAAEQMRVLGHIGLVAAQARRVDVAGIDAAHRDGAGCGVPKAHEQLKQRRLARTRAPHDTGHGTGRKGAGHVVEDEIRSGVVRDLLCGAGTARVHAARIAKAHMLGCGAGKLNVLSIGDLGALGPLVEQIEHACARSERLLQ